METRSSYLTDSEVLSLGFASTGRSLRISRFARFYGASRIWLGNEVRVDDFAVLSAGENGIELEGYNHIAVAALVFGDVRFKPWSTLSSRAAVYGTSDDLTVDTHTYPHVEGRVLQRAAVVIGSHVVIGTGSTILPGVTVADGVSVGAMSLLDSPVDRAGVYAGVPARYLRERQRHRGSDGG